MKGTGRIASEVETLLLRSRLGDIRIGVLELVGPELTERSCKANTIINVLVHDVDNNAAELLTKLELITVEVPGIIILKFVPELFDVDFVDNGEVTHDKVEQDPLFGAVFPLHETTKPLRVLHSIISRNHTGRLLVVGMRFIRPIRRVHNIADGAIGGRLPTLDAEFLPPGGLELQADLNGRRIRKLTDSVALSVGQVELVEVDHTQASERHGGNNMRVFLLGPSTSRRTRVMRRVERDRQGIAVVALFDGDGPHVRLRLGADAFSHGLVKNFGTTAGVVKGQYWN
jgi:hypothetical protein